MFQLMPTAIRASEGKIASRGSSTTILAGSFWRNAHTVHTQIVAMLLTLCPLTIETIPVSPKNAPPTRTRIFALCHTFACMADQHPSDIARNIAPRNLVASSFTGQGQYEITVPGEM